MRSLIVALINALARPVDRRLTAWVDTTDSCCDDRSPHRHIEIGDDA